MSRCGKVCYVCTQTTYQCCCSLCSEQPNAEEPYSQRKKIIIKRQTRCYLFQAFTSAQFLPLLGLGWPKGPLQCWFLSRYISYYGQTLFLPPPTKFTGSETGICGLQTRRYTTDSKPGDPLPYNRLIFNQTADIYL